MKTLILFKENDMKKSILSTVIVSGAIALSTGAFTAALAATPTPVTSQKQFETYFLALKDNIHDMSIAMYDRKAAQRLYTKIHKAVERVPYPNLTVIVSGSNNTGYFEKLAKDYSVKILNKLVVPPDIKSPHIIAKKTYIWILKTAHFKSIAQETCAKPWTIGFFQFDPTTTTLIEYKPTCGTPATPTTKSL